MAEERQNHKLGRRTFLSGLGLFFGGLSLGGGAIGSILAPKQRGQEEGGGGRAENQLGPLLYDYGDFRDVAQAKGLEVLTKMANIQEPILVVFGADHIEGFKYYALNPVEREGKFITYFPYHVIAGPQLQIYQPSKGNWQMIQKQNL